MNVVGPKPAAFRHLVFPDVPRVAPPINFAPADESAEQEDIRSAVIETEEQSFLTAVLEAGGLDVDDYKLETLSRRVPACLRALRVGTLSEASQLLRRYPAMLKTAISALVIGVTGFFRDPSVFSVLGQRVLPDLAGRGTLARIWSVGCSEGAELYSVAMLLADMNVLHRCHLLGTDCRPDAITRAADGVYDALAIKSLPTPMVRRHGAQTAGGWKIHASLRAAAHWRSANVLGISEPGAWDMILCRNVAIYLRARASAKLWRTLYASLRPGGFLVLGRAERPLGASGFTMVGPCVFKRNRN